MAQPTGRALSRDQHNFSATKSWKSISRHQVGWLSLCKWCQSAYCKDMLLIRFYSPSGKKITFPLGTTEVEQDLIWFVNKITLTPIVLPGCEFLLWIYCLYGWPSEKRFPFSVSLTLMFHIFDVSTIHFICRRSAPSTTSTFISLNSLFWSFQFVGLETQNIKKH